MDCGGEQELLSAFRDGETSEEESRRVEEHLAACAPCRAAQRRMLALDAMIARSEMEVPPGFRDVLYARMEAEELLPRRRNLFSFSFRWALPLAAAAALGLLLLFSREAPQGPAAPGNAPPVAAREELTTEEREIVAYLELLEDPSSFEEPGEVREMEILLPPARGQG